MRGTARRKNHRERMERSAAERIGHENAYLLLVWMPLLKVAVPAAAVFLAGWWLWENVDHGRIVTVAAVLGILCLVTYAARLLTAGGAKARMRARVMGQRVHAGWHMTGAAGALLVVGALLVAGA